MYYSNKNKLTSPIGVNVKLSNRKKIKMLENTKNDLLQQKEKGFDVAKILDIVDERIKYYRELGKILRKNKKKHSPRA